MTGLYPLGYNNILQNSEGIFPIFPLPEDRGGEITPKKEGNKKC